MNSTDNEILFKSNYEYLFKTYNVPKLKQIGRELGEINVTKNNETHYSKSEIINLILKNSNYQLLSVDKINELYAEQMKKADEDYIINLKKRLYDKTITEYNPNYDKPCLLFNKDDTERVYGGIQYYKKTSFAYRVAYALYKNIKLEDIPAEDECGNILQLCHGKNCSKKCIEPTHLELKTIRENMYDDKIRDGTLKIGESHHSSKITNEKALEIINSKGKMTQKQRSEKYNVSIHIVQDIDRGKTRSHLSNIKNTDEERDEKKDIEKKRRVENKKKEFTNDEYLEAIVLLREKSTLSETISETVDTHCHLFIGKKDKDGYCKICFKGINFLIHILAYEAKIKSKRDLQGENKVIRHLCNVPSCCNPEHLDFSTFSKNRIDAVLNENHKGIKLNPDKVREIRVHLQENKLNKKEIGNLYGVTNRTICDISTGKAWSHVT